jgi:hypothetical protein
MDYPQYWILVSKLDTKTSFPHKTRAKESKRGQDTKGSTVTNLRLLEKKLESYLCFLLVKTVIYRNHQDPMQYICERLDLEPLRLKVKKLIEVMKTALKASFEAFPTYEEAADYEFRFCKLCNTNYATEAGHLCNPNNKERRFEIPDCIDEEDQIRKHKRYLHKLERNRWVI